MAEAELDDEMLGRLGGEVTNRYVAADGEHCVDVRTWSVNQRGEEVMPGTATLALPRAGQPSPVEARAGRQR